MEMKHDKRHCKSRPLEMRQKFLKLEKISLIKQKRKKKSTNGKIDSPKIIILRLKSSYVLSSKDYFATKKRS